MGQSRKNLLTKSKMSQDMIFWGLLLAATVLVFARPKSEKCTTGCIA